MISISKSEHIEHPEVETMCIKELVENAVEFQFNLMGTFLSGEPLFGHQYNLENSPLSEKDK